MNKVNNILDGFFEFLLSIWNWVYFLCIANLNDLFIDTSRGWAYDVWPGGINEYLELNFSNN